MKSILDETKIIVDKLKINYKPEKVILFGSVGRGEAGKDSDIDLLIIKNSKKKRPLRVSDVFKSLRGLDREYGLDVIVYTPDEIKHRLAIGDDFIETVLSEGRVIYG